MEAGKFRGPPELLTPLGDAEKWAVAEVAGDMCGGELNFSTTLLFWMAGHNKESRLSGVTLEVEGNWNEAKEV